MSSEGAARDVREQLQTAMGGTYTVERELGGAGMSRVFVAEDARLGRRVVVKVLHPDLAAGINAARFEREVRLTARLQHPHIVPVHTAGEIGGLPYYTMPLVEGESLRARLAREGALPIAGAVRLLHELADALCYAHGHGVVHRDLKPENVLLSGGHAMVADFGVAKALASATQGGAETPEATVTGTRSGGAVGTPAYMAPEQALGEAGVDHRADLYALGVIAYELLTGAHPFAGRSAPAVVAAHLTEMPAPLAVRRPDVPPALALLVHRLLGKRPEERPASAAQVLGELDAVGTPSSVTAWRLITHRPLRSRVGWAALATVVVLGLVGAGMLARDYLEASTDRQAVDATTDATTDVPVRLAILPFENRGAAGDDDFADGLADAIRGQLAALPALAVIDSRSTGQYRASTKDVREIGRELGVAYVLQGTVRWERRPDGTRRLQVRPALVRVADAATRWAAPYTAEPSDLFQVQADIAGRVATALEVTIAGRGPGSPGLPAAPPTSNPDAYEAYLRGLGLAQRAVLTAGVPDLRAVAGATARAVALDPRFGVAWASLAVARLSAWGYAGGGDAALLDSARVALDSARRLAPDAPETHAAVGVYAALVEGDWERGADHLRRVHELRPSDAAVLAMMAEWLAWTPRFDEALTAFARTAELDPLTPPIRAANHFRRAGRYAEAIRYAERVIALVPEEIVGYNLKALALIDSGAGTAAARAVLDSAVARAGPTAVVKELAHTWTTDVAGMLGGGYEAWQHALTLADYGPTATPADSATYYRTKALAWRRKGDSTRMAAYCDSAARLLALVVGPGVPDLARARPSVYTAVGYLAQMSACAGRRGDARRLAAAFSALRRSPGQHDEGIVAFMLGRVYLMLGDLDAAMTQFERSLQPPHDHSVAWLRADPFYAPLRGRPRFEALLARGSR